MRLHVVPLSDMRVGNCSEPRFLIVMDEVALDRLQSTMGMGSSCEALDGCVGTLVFSDHVDLKRLDPT